MTGRSSTVLLLVPSVPVGLGVQESIDELSDHIARRGLHLVVQFARNHPTVILDDIARSSPVAVVDLGVLPSETREAVRASGVVVVPEALVIRSEEFQHLIGRAMIQRLVKRRTVRRFLYAASTDVRSYLYDTDRYAGLREAAAEFGLEDPVRVDIPLDLAGAVRALRSHLIDHEPLGVACCTDVVALAVMAVCRELRRGVPDDVAVIGVDATAEGQLVSPRLTSIRTDQHAIGEGLAAELLAAIDGVHFSVPVRDAVPVSVVEGETV
ncbi:Transcriptional regulators-like protein [Parafrankia sp. EAN1pec]|nr:Transcriptional regulators-like protein [Frankia sp. EAN1pec]